MSSPTTFSDAILGGPNSQWPSFPGLTSSPQNDHDTFSFLNDADFASLVPNEGQDRSADLEQHLDPLVPFDFNTVPSYSEDTGPNQNLFIYLPEHALVQDPAIKTEEPEDLPYDECLHAAPILSLPPASLSPPINTNQNPAPTLTPIPTPDPTQTPVPNSLKRRAPSSTLESCKKTIKKELSISELSTETVLKRINKRRKRKPATNGNISVDTDDPVAKKRAINTLAARKYRKQRQQEVEKLEERIRQLENERSNLDIEVKWWKMEAQRWKELAGNNK